MMMNNLTELFGIPGAEKIEMHVFDESDLSLPIDPHYIFRKTELKLVLSFLSSQTDGDGLFLYGPFGSGKTTLARQVLARLKWPTLMTSWKKSSDIDDLIGRIGSRYGDTVFEPGPLTLAMKHGYALIINEIDRAMADNVVGLNDILDGGYLLIKETGEIVHPHPDFRLIVTGNSGGMGDTTGMYTGSVRKLDPAFLDRLMFIHVDYMDPVHEIDLFIRAFPEYSPTFIEKMVEFAGETRSSALDVAQPISLAFSTRSLKRFFRLGMDFGLDQIPFSNLNTEVIKQALRPCYLDRISPEDAEAAMALFVMKTGIDHP